MKQSPLLCIHSALLVLLTTLFAGSIIPTTNSQAAPTVWGAKPVLARYVLDPDSAARLQADIRLSSDHLQHIQKIALEEDAQLRRLQAESQAVIGDPGLSAQQKSRWVAHSRYNQRIQTILQENQRRLHESLGAEKYLRLVDWIEARWAQEGALFTPQSGSLKTLAKLAQKTYPRSFEVYATRYDAGDRKIVALPDKCLKFANGGALRCDGYAYGQNYSVAISYQGKMVVALVGESGPWNVDDNYWSTASDPQPRRMYVDLPLGVPEAQAAYFDGYNGGLDQFGRLVTSPVAIDISKALAVDLGLGPGNNQVTVSFMWTDGWDAPQAKPGNNASAPDQAAPPAPNAAIAWEIATANPDGSIIHIVKAGQTLVGIATIYNLPLADLLAMNNLTTQSVIHPGDKILIKPANPTSTPIVTAARTAEPTSRPTRTPTTASTPTLAPSPSPHAYAALSLAPNPTEMSPVDWILAAIIFVGLAGLILLAWGLAIRRRGN
jgi:hypothetical protein